MHPRLLLVGILPCTVAVQALPVGSSLAAASPRGRVTPTVVYQPSGPGQYVGYPRIIRLAHSGQANGTLLAGFDIYAGGTDRLLLYRSANGGRSWSHLATIADAAYGGRTCCMALFELPRTMGGQPSGTLLLGESAGAAGTIGHEIKVLQSHDHGRTWRYLSSCAKGAGGLWEPDFAIDRTGRLVCYFSDVRRAEYSQFLGHVLSVDGGRTWDAEGTDVAIPDGSSRPGMATVLRVRDGLYVMSFELCGRTNCEVHIKVSADGDRWGRPDEVGVRVQTADGRYAGHTPTIAWAPAGGPRGTLLLVSQDLFDPDDLVAADSRRVVMINRRDGTGPWTLAAAPIQIAPGGPDCVNYSTALLPSPTGRILGMVASVRLSAGGCRILYAAASLPVTAP